MKIDKTYCIVENSIKGVEMFNLFIKPRYPDLDSFVKFPEWGYLEMYIKDNIKNIKKYCRGIEELCSEKNIIVRLLQTITTDLTLPDEKFLQKTLADIGNKANILGIGVGSNRPTIFKNNLNVSSQEIFVGELDDKQYRDMLKNITPWEDLVPLQPLYHNYRTLDYEIREGKRNLENTLIIYNIDLIALIMMYKNWFKIRKMYSKSTKPQIFVQQFVLPNTLEQDINLILFNKTLEFSINRKIFPNGKFKYPIFLKEVSLLVDKVLLKAVDSIKAKSLEYERVINTIPIVHSPTYRVKNMMDVLKVDDIFFKMQMRWVLWLARMSYIKGLLILGSTSSLQRNKDYNLSLQENLKEFVTGNIYIKEQNIGTNAYAKFINDLYFIKDLILPSLNIKL